jgi:hypothetical protein
MNTIPKTMGSYARKVIINAPVRVYMQQYGYINSIQAVSTEWHINSLLLLMVLKTVRTRSW